MKEAYVTHETAKLLKEKRFDWECLARYDKPIFSNNVSIFTEEKAIDWNTYYYSSVYKCSAPTQQMAMRWLREEKGIHIYLIPVTGFKYVVSIYTEQGNKRYDKILLRTGRHAYEDAVEVALQYCLTNLI